MIYRSEKSASPSRSWGEGASPYRLFGLKRTIWEARETFLSQKEGYCNTPSGETLSKYYPTARSTANAIPKSFFSSHFCHPEPARLFAAPRCLRFASRRRPVRTLPSAAAKPPAPPPPPETDAARSSPSVGGVCPPRTLDLAAPVRKSEQLGHHSETFVECRNPRCPRRQTA